MTELIIGYFKKSAARVASIKGIPEDEALTLLMEGFLVKKCGQQFKEDLKWLGNDFLIKHGRLIG